MKSLSRSAFAAILLVLLISAYALANGAYTPATTGQGPKASITSPAPPTQQQKWTVNQLIPLSVGEAWTLSGKNYSEMTKMIAALVSLSEQKRGVVIPDTKEAGNELGCLIRKRAEADPNQLLYVVVDSAVRDYAVQHNLS